MTNGRSRVRTSYGIGLIVTIVGVVVLWAFAFFNAGVGTPDPYLFSAAKVPLYPGFVLAELIFGERIVIHHPMIGFLLVPFFNIVVVGTAILSIWKLMSLQLGKSGIVSTKNSF